MTHQLINPIMTSKPIWQSKTFWLNAITLLSVFIPQVAAWLKDNPQTAITALTALNVLVRFATSGRISLFGAGEENSDGGAGGGTFPCMLIGLAAAGLLGVTALPSCSTAQLDAAKSIPIHNAEVITKYGTIGYSSKGGIDLIVDARSGK